MNLHSKFSGGGTGMCAHCNLCGFNTAVPVEHFGMINEGG